MKKIQFKVTVITTIIMFGLNACAGSQLTKSSPIVVTLPTITPTATPVLLGEYELFSPDDLRSDVDQLFHVIEAFHPAPYAKRSKQDIDLERQHLYQELSQPMTDIEFYKKIAPLLNSLGDYHTNIFPGDETINVIRKNELLLPFEIQINGQHAYIVANYSGNASIEYGDELLEVNGTPMTEIMRFWPVGRHFLPMDVWFLLGSSHEYQVKLLPQSQIEPITLIVPGLTDEEMQSNTEMDKPIEAVQYTTLPGENIGVLTINNFWKVAPLVNRAMLQVRDDQVQHLIIDLRSNRGGLLIQAETTINYLITQPYRTCSLSYTAPFDGYGSAKPTEIECEQKYPKNISQPYQGKLYVLIGPDTVSAGVLFATVLQDHKLAILIGEETDTPASMCGNVVLERAHLSHTRLQYRYSRTCYVRPNGILDDHGVIPDIMIKTTINDQINNTDPVLDHTLQMIREGE